MNGMDLDTTQKYISGYLTDKDNGLGLILRHVLNDDTYIFENSSKVYHLKPTNLTRDEHFKNQEFNYLKTINYQK